MRKSVKTVKVKVRFWSLTALLSLATLIISGCALGLPTGDGGGVAVGFPRGILAKSPDATISYDIYIYRNNSRVRGPISGTLDFGSQESIKIDALPAGGGYQVVIIGETKIPSEEEEWSENFFAVTKNPIKVPSGGVAQVRVPNDVDSVAYERIPFKKGDTTTPKRFVKEVVASDGGVFALLDDRSVYWLPEEPDDEIFELLENEYLTGQTESLSLGYYSDLGRSVLFNTNEWAWTFGDEGFESIFNEDLEQIQLEDKKIVKSSVYDDFAVLLTNDYLIGNFGSSEPFALNKIELGDGLEILDMFAYPLSGEDYSVYLATNHGAFVLTSEFFDVVYSGITLLSLLSEPDEVPIISFNSPDSPWGPSKPSIRSFGWDPGNPGGSELLIGTDNGVYSAEIGPEGLKSSDEDPEPGTRGLRIEKIVVRHNEDPETSAYAVKTSSGVIFAEDEDDDVHHLPFLDLLVGKVNDVGVFGEYYEGSYQWHYLVAGEEGLVVIWEDDDD